MGPKFLQGWPRMLTRDLFAVANLIVSSCLLLLSRTLCDRSCRYFHMFFSFFVRSKLWTDFGDLFCWQLLELLEMFCSVLLHVLLYSTEKNNSIDWLIDIQHADPYLPNHDVWSCTALICALLSAVPIIWCIYICCCYSVCRQQQDRQAGVANTVANWQHLAYNLHHAIGGLLKLFVLT